jgi:hypothetical protein
VTTPGVWNVGGGGDDEQRSEPAGCRPAGVSGGGMSGAEIAQARERFRLDQEHAEYAEYLEARARISRTWYWRRTLRRFLRDHGYSTARSAVLGDDPFPG